MLSALCSMLHVFCRRMVRLAYPQPRATAHQPFRRLTQIIFLYALCSMLHAFCRRKFTQIHANYFYPCPPASITPKPRKGGTIGLRRHTLCSTLLALSF